MAFALARCVLPDAVVDGGGPALGPAGGGGRTAATGGGGAAAGGGGRTDGGGAAGASGSGRPTGGTTGSAGSAGRASSGADGDSGAGGGSGATDSGEGGAAGTSGDAGLGGTAAGSSGMASRGGTSGGIGGSHAGTAGAPSGGGGSAGASSSTGVIRCGESSCRLLEGNECCFTPSASTSICQTATSQSCAPEVVDSRLVYTNKIGCNAATDCAGGEICCYEEYYITARTLCVPPLACATHRVAMESYDRIRIQACDLGLSPGEECQTGTCGTRATSKLPPHMGVCEGAAGAAAE